MGWRLLLVLLALSCTACTRLREFPVEESFRGIHARCGEERTVSVLFVHGIGGYSEGDPEGLISGIVRELDLCASGEECLRRVRGGEPEEPFGWVRRRDYYEACSQTHFRMYTVDWREATWAEKALIRDLDRMSRTHELMAPLLSDGRKGFINNGLTDIALYLGHFGPAIRFPLQQAMRWVAEDARECKNHELVIVTYSMGCHLVLEALDELCRLDTNQVPTCDQVRAELIRETRAFFMLSSELPLLYFSQMHPPKGPYQFQDGAYCEYCEHCFPSADLDEPQDTVCWEWERTALGSFMRDKRAWDPDFQIVVINDPNDILSYRVEDVFIPENAAKDVFVNINVRNAKYRWLGRYADPIKAHEGYGKNPQVIRLISHGTCPGCSTRCARCTCRDAVSADPTVAGKDQLQVESPAPTPAG